MKISNSTFARNILLEALASNYGMFEACFCRNEATFMKVNDLIGRGEFSISVIIWNVAKSKYLSVLEPVSSLGHK